MLRTSSRGKGNVLFPICGPQQTASAEKEFLLDPAATGSCDITNTVLGDLSADESRRSALIQLANMGATLIGSSSER